MASLLDNIKSDLTTALKGRDDLKLQTLRMLSSAVHNEEIAKGADLTDEEVVTIVKREIKKRKEAIEMFKTAGRDEKADQESAELVVLEGYLPAQMSEAEIVALIDKVLAENSGANAGQIIGLVMKETSGNADGGLVAKLVNQKLS